MTNVLQKDNRRPINVAAERAALAGIAQYGSKVFSDVQEILSIDCFTVPENRMIYDISKHIMETSERVDIASILSTASSLGYGDLTSKKEIADYVRSIFSFPINSDNVRKNAVMIKKLQVARNAQDKLKDAWLDLSNITGNESISEIISRVEGPILGMDFGSNNSDDETIYLAEKAEEILEYFESLDGKISGIPSPFNRYNQCIGGSRRPGYVYLIGARPKSGKTQMAIFDALYVSINLGIPVLYVDTEMKPVDMIARIYSSMSNVPFPEIESGSFKFNSLTKTRVYEALKKFKAINKNFAYRKVSGKPFDEILSIIRKWITHDVGLENGKAKPCLIIYDYFKLMDSSDLKNMQEYQALGFQINELTNFCGKYDVPCSAYVQLNRDGVSKETSDVISQSDRLLWLCASFAILKRKSDAEIQVDGVENGNAKLIPTSDQRFGPGLGEGDWINMSIQYDRCIFEEGVTRREAKKNKGKDTGFESIDDNEESNDGFSDNDFDNAATGYRDDEYRKT